MHSQENRAAGCHETGGRSSMNHAEFERASREIRYTYNFRLTAYPLMVIYIVCMYNPVLLLAYFPPFSLPAKNRQRINTKRASGEHHQYDAYRIYKTTLSTTDKHEEHMSDNKGGDMDNDFTKATDKNPSNIMPEKLTLDSPLRFECHSGVSCFTACCHDIQIVLTPYDIMILRKRLNIAAHEFIVQYTEPTFLEKTDMPGVQMKMTEEKSGCPFVSSEGCAVYEDRPTACRYYPVGMADFHEGGQEDAKEEKFFFLVKEPHCKGFEEAKQWTIGEWRTDQGLDVRDEMNKEWLRLIMRRKSFGHQATLSEAAQRMFFMASTDMDHFRKFVFESSFLDTYEVDQETIDTIKEDDEALMLFSFKYLANTLFGAEGMSIRKNKIAEKTQEIQQDRDDSLQKIEKEYEELKAERARLKKEEEERRS